jgi:Fe-S cluster biogenesis protein NfuA
VRRSDQPPSGDTDELLAKIHETIDKYVRPALATDGGGLEIQGLEGTTVLVRYQGACGGCGSAVTGTLMAIENLLQTEVDENLTVAAI